jgi:hypothetical protein
MEPEAGSPPGVKEKKMKTFYCVMTEFFDDGRVNAGMITRACKEKPKDSYRHLPRMDAYNDWFDTEAEAAAFLAEAKAA